MLVRVFGRLSGYSSVLPRGARLYLTGVEVARVSWPHDGEPVVTLMKPYVLRFGEQYGDEYSIKVESASG